MVFDETLAESILGFKASDSQLLEIIACDNDSRRGNAFRTLISRHHHAIQVAIRSAGAQRAEDREEAFSKFCVKISEELQKNGLKCIRNREKPVGWLYKTARNAAVDHLRSLKEDRESDKDTRPPAPIDPIDWVIQNEKADAIMRDIERLTGGYREAADLVIQEYTRGEIAEMLDIPLGTVDSRIGTIRKKLKHRKQTESD